MTLIETLQQRVWECSRNKSNKGNVVQSLYISVRYHWFHKKQPLFSDLEHS